MAFALSRTSLIKAGQDRSPDYSPPPGWLALAGLGTPLQPLLPATHQSIPNPIDAPFINLICLFVSTFRRIKSTATCLQGNRQWSDALARRLLLHSRSLAVVSSRQAFPTAEQLQHSVNRVIRSTVTQHQRDTLSRPQPLITMLSCPDGELTSFLSCENRK